jgi:hypothetical protein
VCFSITARVLVTPPLVAPPATCLMVGMQVQLRFHTCSSTSAGRCHCVLPNNCNTDDCVLQLLYSNSLV